MYVAEPLLTVVKRTIAEFYLIDLIGVGTS